MCDRFGFWLGTKLARPAAWLIFQVASRHRPTRLKVLRWLDASHNDDIKQSRSVDSSTEVS